MSEMNRVLVKIRGSQVDLAGEESVIEMMAAGKHYLHKGKHYVLYEDTASSEGSASTVLKFDEHTVTLLRHGSIEHTQEFLPQQESRSAYRTPVGNLEMTVRTEKLDVDFGTVSGTLDLLYDLAVNGRPQSRNSLHIEVACAPEDKHKLN